MLGSNSTGDIEDMLTAQILHNSSSTVGLYCQIVSSSDIFLRLLELKLWMCYSPCHTYVECMNPKQDTTVLDC